MFCLGLVLCLKLDTRVGILDVNDDLGLNNPIKPACGEDVVISFTGTILEKYPRFRERCQIYMDQGT